MIVKIGSKGQLTIPKEIREKWNLKPGDKLALINQEKGFLLEPITVDIFDLKGSIPVQPDGPYTLEQIREKTAEYRVRHILGLDEEDE